MPSKDETNKMFEIKDVAKYYGDVKAVDGVTLSADEGKIFGLLGPNGAGKTTVVRFLSTLLVPDRGTVKVRGVDALEHPEKVREMIGLAGQYAALDEYLTGYENVFMTGRLYHLSRTEARKRALKLLEQLGLAKAANRTVRTYSGGMRRRLDLGASLIGEPKILLLDEPTTGLDPKTRKDLWGIIRELVKNGTSILLTTQYLEEADELADKIAVMNDGKVIAEGTSDDLKTQMGGDIVEFTLAKPDSEVAARVAMQPFAKAEITYDAATSAMRVPVSHGSKALMGIVQSLNDAKLSVEELSLHRPSLDDVFLALTGDKAKPKELPVKKGRRR